MSMRWTVSQESIRIRLSVSLANTWAGIGYDHAATGGMELADMTIGEFDTANPTKQIARDYWSPAYGRPQLDTALGGRDNVVFVSGSSDASSTVYEFERPLAASDTYDKAIRSGSMSVVYAHGNYSQPQLLKHPNAYRARAVVDFFASGSCPNDCSGCRCAGPSHKNPSASA
eukprot:TRINITY_DN137_c0_g1_i21.p1 TRINITY_DN137_c0_g1~~TRINITY_DN137_c0_g1_i21.p1  ORF type:complete len:172 (+),score=31.06 TRINITY_DN137_c0_g1_i21:1-516(+)